MKSILLAFCLLFPALIWAQDSTAVPSKFALNPEVTWQNFAQGVEQIQQDSTQNRLLIFLYAEDCGWCKRMVDSSYTASEIQTYLKDTYVMASVNVDDTTPYPFKEVEISDRDVAIALKAEWSVPTHLIAETDEAGKIRIVGRIDGYVDAPDFIKMLKYYHSDAFLNKSFDAFKADGCQPESCR